MPMLEGGGGLVDEDIGDACGGWSMDEEGMPYVRGKEEEVEEDQWIRKLMTHAKEKEE